MLYWYIVIAMIQASELNIDFGPKRGFCKRTDTILNERNLVFIGKNINQN